MKERICSKKEQIHSFKCCPTSHPIFFFFRTQESHFLPLTWQKTLRVNPFPLNWCWYWYSISWCLNLLDNDDSSSVWSMMFMSQLSSKSSISSLLGKNKQGCKIRKRKHWSHMHSVIFIVTFIIIAKVFTTSTFYAQKSFFCFVLFSV